MAGLHFAGEVDTLSKQQINFVKNVLKERGFESEKVYIESVGQKGDNYVAIVKRIIVYENEKVKFKMIAKVAPTHETMRQIMKIDLLFTNEITVYSKIFPKFEQLFELQNIPEEQRIRIPACYGYISEAPNELVLLEDLQVSGFQILDKFKPMFSEEIEMVLKSLAVFHSLSYFLKEVEPNTFEIFKDILLNMWNNMDSTPGSVDWLNQLEEDTLSVLNDEKFCKHVKGIVCNLANINRERHEHALISKYSVVQQGDCWTNNIMFRVENGHLAKVCMIDYQLARASSPVNDVYYLTLNCTDHETRSKHWNDWLEIYYEELSKSLTNFGLDVNRVYPREVYKTDLKEYANLATAMSVFLANCLIRTNDEIFDIPDLENLEDLNKESENYRISNMKDSTKKMFRDRVVGCIESMLEHGYIV